MRYAFIASILCVCGIVRGEDAAAIPSVVNHGTPATAVAEPVAAVTTSPAVVVASDCCDCPVAAPTSRSRGRVRFRTVTEGCDACTGQSVRSVTRGVVRGTGTVVRGAGDAVVNVITLPGRVCRNGRCSRN